MTSPSSEWELASHDATLADAMVDGTAPPTSKRRALPTSEPVCMATNQYQSPPCNNTPQQNTADFFPNWQPSLTALSTILDLADAKTARSTSATLYGEIVKHKDALNNFFNLHTTSLACGKAYLDMTLQLAQAQTELANLKEQLSSVHKTAAPPHTAAPRSSCSNDRPLQWQSNGTRRTDTYAAIASKPPARQTHALLIAPAGQTDMTQVDTKKLIAATQKVLNPVSNGICILKSTPTRAKGIALQFADENSAQKAKDVLSSYEELNVTSPVGRRPQIRCRLPNDYNAEDLCSFLRSPLNPAVNITETDSELNVYKVGVNHVISCSTSIWKAIMDSQDGYIYIPMQRIRAYNHLQLRQCFHCGKFGHKKDSCLSPTACVLCASTTHASPDCPHSSDSSKWKCITCINKKNSACSTSHASIQHHLCPYAQYLRQQMQQNINYN